MSKKVSKLAFRYANALKSSIGADGTSESTAKLKNLSEKLLELSQIWETHPNFSTLMLNPMFKAEERTKALVEVAKLVGYPEFAIGFLHVLVQRDRLAVLCEIAHAFKSLVDRAAGIVQVAVVTANQVNEDEKREISDLLAKKLKGDLEFSWSIDDSLIGGIVVSYQGKVLDGSLSGKLSQFERVLLSN